MIFKSVITKLNKKVTGFIKLPKDKRYLFKQGERIKVTINSDSEKIIFFSKICMNALGVYVPKRIMETNNFVNEQEIVFERYDGFFVNIGSGGRVYLPVKIGKQLNLENNDIIKLKISISDLENIFYCKVKTRKKSRTTEYMAFLPKKFYNGRGIVCTIYKFDKNKIRFKHNLDFDNLLKDLAFVEIGKDRAILYLGNRIPVTINTNISLEKISHYLGCFFADGTKRGNDWGICASTFKQANYFKEMHNYLIPGNKVSLSLTITLTKGIEKNIKNIANLWEKNCNVKIMPKRVRLNFSKSTSYYNRNKFGTMIIKEHRQLTQIYYNILIEHLLSIIKKENNAILAQKFICGVMEGDGCPNARGRGHVQIATNKTEVKILEGFLSCSALGFKAYKESFTQKVCVNIGGLGILKNLAYMGPLLFKYYPKRRKRMIERLSMTGAAKFLMRKQQTTSPWILKRFRKNGILNKNNKLTTKGRNIKKALLDLEGQLTT